MDYYNRIITVMIAANIAIALAVMFPFIEDESCERRFSVPRC